MSTATNLIKGQLEMSAFLINTYLQDLKDADFMVRPVPGANHIAWQLGHLISSDHHLINQVCPGTMPDLPAGFEERYKKETAASDDPKAFDTKETFLKLMTQQREAALKALEKLSDSQLDQQSPESIREYCPTVGATFSLLGSHWTMHSGQWVIVRRKLGHKAMF